MYDEFMQMRWCYAEEKEGSRRSVSLPYTMHHNFTYTHTHSSRDVSRLLFWVGMCVCVAQKECKEMLPSGRQ